MWSRSHDAKLFKTLVAVLYLHTKLEATVSFPLRDFGRRKILTKKSFFLFHSAPKKFVLPFQSLKISTSVWPFVDCVKEKQIRFFDCIGGMRWEMGDVEFSCFLYKCFGNSQVRCKVQKFMMNFTRKFENNASDWLLTQEQPIKCPVSKSHNELLKFTTDLRTSKRSVEHMFIKFACSRFQLTSHTNVWRPPVKFNCS